ncbi:hypothetical protein NDU88_001366 [Pleurodeles waltl]|uniref:Uncharacterized protein n=1 Tax=Pleurodeles waltl TaxID=8319 RepID=A0AAV7TI43_PLEWA|nr:hypothetical protein NDU88_001366 [Pleurodeles waltl]
MVSPELRGFSIAQRPFLFVMASPLHDSVFFACIVVGLLCLCPVGRQLTGCPVPYDSPGPPWLLRVSPCLFPPPRGVCRCPGRTWAQRAKLYKKRGTARYAICPSPPRGVPASGPQMAQTR